MFGLGNWIKETTTTSGTGNLTLSSATGFDTFASQFGDATTNTPARPFHYVIKDGNNWETGVGHMSSTTALVRDLVQMTLTAGSMARYGSPLSLSGGSCDVFCDATADLAQAPYCLLGATNGVPFARHGDNWATVPWTANYIMFWPVRLDFGGVFSAIRDHLTAVAGTKYQLGVYSVGKDGKPDKLLARTADLTPATGDNSHSFTGNVFLPPAWYWVAWSGDGACTSKSPSVYGGWPNGPSGVGTDGHHNVIYASALYNPLPADYTSVTSPTISSGSSSNLTPVIDLIRTA